MVARLAVGAWVAVIAAAIAVTLALVIPSIPDIARYMKIRAM